MCASKQTVHVPAATGLELFSTAGAEVSIGVPLLEDGSEVHTDVSCTCCGRMESLTGEFIAAETS